MLVSTPERLTELIISAKLTFCTTWLRFSLHQLLQQLLHGSCSFPPMFLRTYGGVYILILEKPAPLEHRYLCYALDFTHAFMLSGPLREKALRSLRLQAFHIVMGYYKFFVLLLHPLLSGFQTLQEMCRGICAVSTSSSSKSLITSHCCTLVLVLLSLIASKDVSPSIGEESRQRTISKVPEMMDMSSDIVLCWYTCPFLHQRILFTKS